MPELFVWYHADASMETALRRWVEGVAHQLRLTAHLYVRHTVDKTTFMEVYTDISGAQQQRLQQIVADTSLFNDIERHSEVFQRLF